MGPMCEKLNHGRIREYERMKEADNGGANGIAILSRKVRITGEGLGPILDSY